MVTLRLGEYLTSGRNQCGDAGDIGADNRCDCADDAVGGGWNERSKVGRLPVTLARDL